MPRYDVPRAAPEPLRLVQRFVNTVDLEHGVDWLSTPADLEPWLAELGEDVVATRADLRRARELRAALRELLLAHNARRPYPEDACATVDGVAERARLRPRILPGGGLVLEPGRGGTAGALGRLVAVVAAAVAAGDFARLKACRNCRWAFYDGSRNRGGTWCSMVLCGNRLKTRRYRERRRTPHATPD